MTPEQMTTVGVLASLIQTVGPWPLGVLTMCIFLGPWIALLMISRAQDGRASKHDKRSLEMVAAIKEEFSEAKAVYEKRFESVVNMYERNVELVDAYNKHTGQLTEILTLNIQVQTELVENIEKNRFCPVLKDQGP